MGAYGIVRGRPNKEEVVGDLEHIKLGKGYGMWKSVVVFYVVLPGKVSDLLTTQMYTWRSKRRKLYISGGQRIYFGLVKY